MARKAGQAQIRKGIKSLAKEPCWLKLNFISKKGQQQTLGRPLGSSLPAAASFSPLTGCHPLQHKPLSQT